MADRDPGPGVKVPPPLWFLLCVGGAWGLHQVLPLGIAPPLVEFGLAVMLLGVGLIVAALVLDWRTLGLATSLSAKRRMSSGTVIPASAARRANSQ